MVDVVHPYRSRQAIMVRPCGLTLQAADRPVPGYRPQVLPHCQMQRIRMLTSTLTAVGTEAGARIDTVAAWYHLYLTEGLEGLENGSGDGRLTGYTKANDRAMWENFKKLLRAARIGGA